MTMPLPSPSASQYSLNLGELDDSSAFIMSPTRQTRVYSSEINGPSDFTLNMIDLIKGRKAPTSPPQATSAKATTIRPGGILERIGTELAAEKGARRAESAAYKAELGRMAEYTSQLKAAFAAERVAHAKEMERISAEMEEATSAMDAEITLLKGELQAATAEAEHLRPKQHQRDFDIQQSHKATFEREKARQGAQHEHELKKITTAHAVEIERLKSEHALELEAVKAAAPSTTSQALLVAEIDSLTRTNSRRQKAMNNLEATHIAEVQLLLREQTAAAKKRDITMKQQIHVRETQYKETIAARDQELLEQSIEIKDLKVTNDALEKLRRNLSKQLMRAWGKAEFGDTGDKQKYKYSTRSKEFPTKSCVDMEVVEEELEEW